MAKKSRSIISEENNFTEAQETSSAEVETTGPETKNGIIINSLFVNIRSEANPESDVIGIMRKGDKVNILGREGGFHKISTDLYKFAYISSEFIKEE